MATSFEVSIPQSRLDEVMERVRAFRPFPVIADDVPLTPALLSDILRHWTQGYDWREQERKLNAFPQFVAEIDGEALHFVHERSSRPNAPAELLIHGWPNTHQQFLPLIERLAHPEPSGC